MKKKRFLSLILSLCMVFTICLPATAASSYSFSGKCGSNLTWTYSLLNQTLTISGTGDMYNYEIGDTIATSSGTSEIWKNVPPTAIEKVIIEDGVTSVGDNAFGNLQYMSSITLPSTIKSIGKYAFASCKRLATINVADLGKWSEIIIDGTYSHPADYSKGRSIL